MKHQRYFRGKDQVTLMRLIKEKTGYSFSSTGILSQAFRRRSYCVEESGKSNESLEFLGDQVISYYVMKLIAQRSITMNIESDYSSRFGERGLTAIKHRLTSNELFSAIVDEWEIAEYMIVGKCDEQNRVDQQTKVKADLFEAIIGAIAVASNWDQTVLETAVSRALNLEVRLQEIVENEYNWYSITVDNAIMRLKELAEKERCSMPKYEFWDLGKDANGNPVWGCSAYILNDETFIHRSVRASSKKEAQKACAYLILCEQLEMQNLYGINKFFPIWIYRDGKMTPDMLM